MLPNAACDCIWTHRWLLVVKQTSFTSPSPARREEPPGSGPTAGAEAAGRASLSGAGRRPGWRAVPLAARHGTGVRLVRSSPFLTCS